MLYHVQKKNVALADARAIFQENRLELLIAQQMM
jgi:hypothetical protein